MLRRYPVLFLLTAALVLGLLAGASGLGIEDAAIRFENVTASSGLAFVLQQHATPDRHMVETMAGGLAIFDYDGDGRPDIFFTNGAALPGWRKRRQPTGTGSFTTTATSLHGCHRESGCEGTATRRAPQRRLRQRRSTPTSSSRGVQRHQLFTTARRPFEDVTAASGIKNDDLVRGGRLVRLRQRRLARPPRRQLRGLDAETNRSAAIADRGLRVYCHPKHSRPRATRSTTIATTAASRTCRGLGRIAGQRGRGMAVAFADYDADGFSDFFVTNDSRAGLPLQNKGNGRSRKSRAVAGVALPANGRPVSSMGTDFRDVDNDGWPDLHRDGAVWRDVSAVQQPLGKFIPRREYPRGLGAASVRMAGWSNALVDLDNDGFKDLLTANSHVNDASSSFESQQLPPGQQRLQEPERPLHRRLGTRWRRLPGAARESRHRRRGLRWRRPSGPGDHRLGSGPQLLRNVSDQGHWITLRLVGQKSNRDGILARVRVGSQLDQMTTAVGYASSSNYGVHFGVGAATTIERIEIAWPSGVKQKLENVPADQILTVTEPKDR